jgi:predicted HTH transcriptional regulator
MKPTDEIREGESYSLEFKLVPNEDRNKYLKTAVAFANGKGGRILFGVANDGTVQGIARDEAFAEMDAIVDSIATACSPRIPVDAGIENVDGKLVIAVDVLAGTRCPYFIAAEGDRDGVYVRVGATTRRADDATRRELAFLSEGRSFDGEPCPKAKIDDKRIKALCSKMYRIARKNCDTEAERRTVKRVTPDQLEAWGVISRTRGKWVGSNAYALLAGDPAFRIRLKCGLFKGDDRTVFLDRREFTGSVPELIDAGLAYLLAKINMGCYFKGAYRHDRYELPPDEMRELVINAFAHRSYLEHDAPVFLAVYDTRVEITSPGGFPRGQTAERALAGYSKIRNEVLAKALNYMRFIEEWGSGLKRVNEVLGDYGIGKVAVDDAGFAVRMNVFRADAAANEVANPNAKAKNGGGEVVNEVVNEVVSEAVNGVAKQIYGAIKNNPGIRKPLLLKIVKTSRATAERAIARLQGLRKVEFRGAPKTGGYYCKE